MPDNELRSRLGLLRSTLVPSLSALFLLAACGEERTTTETAREAIDPCALVTALDAEQVWGVEISESGRPSEANNEYLATCRYVAPRGPGIVVLVVMVHSREYGPAAFQTAKQQPFEIQQVAGIGDDAFWIRDPLTTLYVLQGDVYLSIGGGLELDQAQILAQRALGRLP